MSLKEEEIIELIVAYQENRISDKGLHQLKAWLDQDEGHSQKFAHHLSLVKEANMLLEYEQLQDRDAWSSIQKSINKSSKVKARMLDLWLPYAAAVAVFFLVSYIFLFQLPSEQYMATYDFAEVSVVGSKQAVLTLGNGQQMELNPYLNEAISEVDGTLIEKDSANNLTYNGNAALSGQVIYNQIDVPRGGEYYLCLSDGTKVWLNSESSLRYPVQFSGKKRCVELKGEGYFEVAKRPNQAFILKAGDAEVKVLGTKFNVSNYQDDETIATTLVEGSVALSALGEHEILRPGYQAVLKKGIPNINMRMVNTQLYTSWVQGVFEFQNHSLEEICHQLSRWYDVEFFFSEKQYRELRFTGAAKREKPLGFTLSMIEKLADVKFAIRNNKIVVSKPDK